MLLVESGTMQARITEDSSPTAKRYFYYSREDLDRDLARMHDDKTDTKSVVTSFEVKTLNEGDVVFSLTSNTAAIVQKERDGYILTQNFVRIKPDSGDLDPGYLVYLLNEDSKVRKQIMSESGISVNRINVSLLERLKLPPLPSIKRQKLIGDLYFSVKKRRYLQERKADLEQFALLEVLKEANMNDQVKK